MAAIDFIQKKAMCMHIYQSVEKYKKQEKCLSPFFFILLFMSVFRHHQ